MAEKAPKIATHAPRHKQQAAVQPHFVHAKAEVSFFGPAQSHQSLTPATFIQPKLQISKPGDPYEEEADRTADKVMRMAEPATVFAPATPPQENVQRKCTNCEDEEKAQRKEDEKESVQRKEEKDEETVQKKKEEDIQPKLFVNSSGTLVQRMEEEEVQPKLHDEARVKRKEEKDDEEKVQPKLNVIQRQHEEGDVQAKDIHLSRKDRGPPAVSPRFEQNLHSNSGSGRSMDSGTRQFMEKRFDANFSGVKVHTDSNAVQLSSGINAQAFTHGQNIYFNSGRYNPDTGAGRHLLAHELTHTIQQGASKSVQPFLSTKKLSRKAGTSAFTAISKQESACAGPSACKADAQINRQPDYESGGALIQPKENNSSPPPVRPELKRAVAYATSQIGKVDAGKKNEDGTRKGWERLKEYFQVAMGEDKVIPEGGIQTPNSILEKNIKYSSTVKAPQPNKPITDEWKKRDAMPSWCGIFTWWSLIKGGIPMEKWGLGGGAKMKAAYPPGYIPKAGDIAYFNTNSHYAIVEKTEPESPSPSERKNIKVNTVNGNTAGEDNLGGQVQIKQHPISHWAGFFNPLFGLEDKLPKDPTLFTEADFQQIVQKLSGGIPSSATSSPAEVQPYQPTSAPPQVVMPPAKEGSEIAPEMTDALAVKNGAQAATPAPVEEMPSPKSPAEDPAFQQVLQHTASAKNKEEKHGDPGEKSAAAQLASEVPKQLDVDSQAQFHQVGTMNVQKAGTFNKEAFKAQLLERVKKALPKNDRETLDMYEDSTGVQKRMEEAKTNAKGDVKAEKDKAGNAIATTTTAAPNPALATPKETKGMQEEDAGKKPAVPTPEAAAPKPKTDAEVSMEKEAQSLDDEMTRDNVTETQLAKSNETQFTGALEEKKDAQTKARNTPEDYRSKEDPQLTKAKAGAEGRVQGGMEDIHGIRKDELGKVDTHKNNTKSKDETKRKEVASNLQRIYKETKEKVEGMLNALEKEVTDDFEKAASAANTDFEKRVDSRLKDFYGITTVDDTISEWVSGIDPEINQIFTEERDRYVTNMDGAITTIAAKVEKQLNDAMTEIANGKKRIDEYWNSLDPDTKKIGEDAKKEILDQFTELETTVQEKHDALVEKLGDMYVKNLEQLQETFDKIKAANQGWLSGALNAIKAVIETIIRLKDMLFETLSRIAQVIGDIISDPIGFLGNLVTAVGMGLHNFKENIALHLKKGFFEWLMGNLPPGIVFPDKWDLTGIFHFIMQILGLTYANIRSRTVKKLNQAFGGGAGEHIMAALEEVFEIFQIIQKEGLAGLWRYIKEKIGDLKVMVLDAIENFLIEKVVKAGIIFVVSMLNPAGAFIKACQAIYKIVMFFIEKGKQIMEFVNTVIDSIANIVAGNLGGAAKMIEDALARIIPLAIGFLASLLNLDGISEKVQKIIHAIQVPINKAIDWVIDKAIALAKKLGLDKLMKKVKGGIDKGKDFAKRKMEQAKQAGKKFISKIKSWLGLEKKFQGADGSDHRLYFSGSETAATLTVASNPTPFSSFIQSVEVGKDEKKKAAQQKAIPIAVEIDGMKSLPVAGKDDEEKEKNKEKKNKKIQGKLNDLAVPTSVLFGTAIPENGKPKWSPDADSKAAFGGSMTMKPLTKRGLEYGSTPTGASHTIYDIIDQRRQPGGASYYIRGHLLNDNLGGPGSWKNLTPLSREGNHQHEGQVESTVKAAVQSGAIVEYNVTPQYAARGDAAALIAAFKAANDPDADLKAKIVQAEDAVPRGLHCEAYLLKNDGTNFTRQQTLINTTVINPIGRTPESYALSGSKAFEPVRLNSMDVDELMRLHKVDAGFTLAQAQGLADLRKKRGKDFGTYDVLGREMVAAKLLATTAGISKWQQEGYIVL